MEDVLVRGHSQIWGSWFTLEEQRAVAQTRNAWAVRQGVVDLVHARCTPWRDWD